MQIKLLANEMNTLRLSAWNLKKIQEGEKNYNLERYITYKQLNWHAHVRRMNEERVPQKNWWWPPGKRRKGRPRNSWM